MFYDPCTSPSRLFTVLYFSAISSRSRALRYGLPILPTPAPSVHLKIKIKDAVYLEDQNQRRGISKRSLEKTGDCEQSKAPRWVEKIIHLSYIYFLANLLVDGSWLQTIHTWREHQAWNTVDPGTATWDNRISRHVCFLTREHLLGQLQHTVSANDRFILFLL